MQSDQRTTKHPMLLRQAERILDIDGNGDVVERGSDAQHKDSLDRRDAVKISAGRRPARSDENKSTHRR